jgi:hypothetical protein
MERIEMRRILQVWRNGAVERLKMEDGNLRMLYMATLVFGFPETPPRAEYSAIPLPV